MSEGHVTLISAISVATGGVKAVDVGVDVGLVDMLRITDGLDVELDLLEC